MIVGAGAAIRLLLVNAPEALIQTGVDHLPSVGRRHPVCGASLHGDGPRTNPLPVVETDGLQSLVVSVASRVVDVEPRRPLRHTWGGGSGQETQDFSTLWVRVTRLDCVSVVGADRVMTPRRRSEVFQGSSGVRPAANIGDERLTTCSVCVGEHVDGNSPASVRLSPGPHRSCRQESNKDQNSHHNYCLRLYIYAYKDS